MNSLSKFLLLCAVCIVVIAFTVESTFGATDLATCAISVTVDTIVEWVPGNFPAINLDTEESSISNRDDSPEGNKSLVLYLNGNTTLTANTTGTTAQLTDGSDFLITKYTLTFDGNGVAASGATDAVIATIGSDTLEDYSTFLNPGLLITHISEDGATTATLGVEATNDTGTLADAGSYSCTQTITATW
ncbi:MAG: hypothetical protein FVQ79_04465 [Planctomycetes bacterium]|nr:hypothetical protein [Planctomycetota bacterium]